MVLRDWEDFVTFYHYPREHWIHLRTTNPLESVFSGVRLRTNAAKRLSAVGIKLSTWYSRSWNG
ncbi:transposase [Chloroflexota bacterium]